MIKQMEMHTIITLKRQGKSNREVARMTGYDRKTVARYWEMHKADIEALDLKDNIREAQEKITEMPKYDSSGRKPVKYNKEIDAALEMILESEKEKCRLLGERHKQHLTNVQIHRLVCEQGFDIGLTTISDHVREKRKIIKEAYIRQQYDYGDRLEYDFGDIRLVIGGVVGRYYIAAMGSPAGKFRYGYLYKNQKKDVFMDSHVRFFNMVNGVYRSVVYDNMKNVVSKFIGKGEKELNPDLIKMSLYYGFDIDVTNCYSGNEKGYVESSVKVIRNEVFAVKYTFDTFEEAQMYLENELERLNKDSLISEEIQCLLPKRPPLELAKITTQNVDRYSFVCVDNNFYSVPDYMTGREVTVKNYLSDVVVFSDMDELCRHTKIDGFHEISVDIFHYLDTLMRKPGALKHSKALRCKAELKTIYERYFNKRTREFILLLKEHQGKPLDEVAKVLECAGKGVVRVVTDAQMGVAENVLQHTYGQLAALSNFFAIGGETVAN